MPQKHAILLDSNAGAPLHPMVKEALFAFLNSEDNRGNPASAHSFGRGSAALIAETEKAILKTFQASPSEWTVKFTSGGTEANHLAIRTALSEGERGAKWAVSEVEHACVLDLEEEMSSRGAKIQKLRPSPTGRVEKFEEVSKEVRLVSVIGVGNETGIIQQILTSHILSEALSSQTRPYLHTDYVAGWGKAPLDLSRNDSPDFVAIAGHKLGGLSGIGALIHRRRIPVSREGTPNLLGIASLRAIADHWTALVSEYESLRPLRDRFETELTRRFPQVVVTGADLERVPNVSHFYFAGLSRDLSLVSTLDLRGFAVSSGSACASQVPEPSHVLLAMGLAPLDARNALRVSLFPGNTWGDLSGLLDALTEVLRRYENR